MKLPEKIKGRNRVRDGAIVLYFKRDKMDYPFLAEKFGLTERRILQILIKNHAYVKRDKVWEKEKRINILERLVRSKGNKTSKDIVDLLAEIRKEIEGDQGGIDSSKGDTYIINLQNIQRGDRPVGSLIKDFTRTLSEANRG